MKIILNERGQGLIEYLVIVALVAVAGITIMKVVGQNVRAQFARVASVIQGENPKDVKMNAVRASQYKSRDMSDFFRGTTTRAQRGGTEDDSGI
jgi:Flp pilus assembly pilin Flp